MSKTNDNNSIPQLRFPGFTEEWKEKKLGEIYEKHNEKNDLSFGVDKIISVANMYYKQDANVGNDDYLKTYNIFRLGDIAYEGHKSSNFAYGRFVENTIGDGIVSHVFDVYRPITADYCIDYWKYAINYEPIMRPILEKATIKSTMMNNLIAKDFLKQSILTPPSPAEQQKIADCLSSLDDMIRAEGQKTEVLREYKRGLMQQLFPANGASTPQLRFPGFIGEWKEKKLGEVCDRITEKVGNVLLEPISVSANVGIISQKQRFGKDISGEQYKNYIHIKKGDYCYNKGNSKYFPQGCIYELHTYEEAAAPNAFISFRFKDSVVPHFFNGYFDQNAHGKQLVQYITSGARSDGLLNLNVEDFFKIKFLLPPTLAEQKKIADCLSSLDEMISAQAQKTETLREYKRGLMQQLFPQPSK